MKVGWSVTKTIPVLAAGGIYASGDVLGGLVSFNGILDNNFKAGDIVGGIVSDSAGVTTDCSVYIFDANPTASTFTDNAAFAINSADLSKLAVVLTKVTALTVGSSKFLTFKTDLGLNVPIQANSSTLYVVVVTNQTPTYTNNCLTLKLAVEKDVTN